MVALVTTDSLSFVDKKLEFSSQNTGVLKIWSRFFVVEKLTDFLGTRHYGALTRASAARSGSKGSFSAFKIRFSGFKFL